MAQGAQRVADSVQESAKADIIFLALPWKNLKQAISGVSSWKGHIVIDPTNPVIMPGFQLPDPGGKTSSEIVQELVPGARLVKAFNTLTPAILNADPRQSGARQVIFYSGNYDSAKTMVLP